MKILILYSSISDNAKQDQLDTLYEVKSVKKSLINLGHKVFCSKFGSNIDKNMQKIKKIQPNFIFNLVEDFLGDGKLVYLIPGFLDKIGISYSGSGTQAMFLTTDKILSKKIMILNNIYTADRFDLKNIDIKTLNIDSKYIVKPVCEDASIGIDKGCIIAGSEKTKIRDKLLEKENKFGYKFFVEEFIDGREFNVSIMNFGGKIFVLPPAEIVFTKFQNRPKIIDYKAKWDEKSFEYKNTNRNFDFGKKDKELINKLKKITMQCWNIFQLEGYARVDFRVDKNQRCCVLEVNTNPCISPDAGFFAACQKHGISYDEMVNSIINI